MTDAPETFDVTFDLFGNIESMPIAVVHQLGEAICGKMPSNVDVALVKQSKARGQFTTSDVAGIVMVVNRSYKGVPLRQRVSLGQAHTILAYLETLGTDNPAFCFLLEYNGDSSLLSQLTEAKFLEGGDIEMLPVSGPRQVPAEA